MNAVSIAEPIGVDVFRAERQAFYRMFEEFMRDDRIPAIVRDSEFRNLIAGMSGIAVLVDVQ